MHQLRLEPKSPDLETEIVVEGLSDNEEIENSDNWNVKKQSKPDEIPLPSFLSEPEIQAEGQKPQISQEEFKVGPENTNLQPSEPSNQIEFR